MESRVWTRLEEKFAHILILKGDQVHHLKVTGLMLKRKVQGILEKLEQGEGPAAVGGKHRAFDVRTIAKAEVSPGNGSLTLHREADGAKIGFTSPNSDADSILAAIVERSGRTFEASQEEIGVVEALIPPAFVGAIGGLFWMGIASTAADLARGEAVEVSGRRQGMQKVMIRIAETLGTTGTTIVGVVLLATILGWAGSRIVNRPRRSVWLPVPG